MGSRKAMIVQQHTPRRKAAPARPERTAKEAHPDDDSILGSYQQQIAQLESTTTHLRQRIMELNASTSDLVHAKGRLSDLFQNAPVGYVLHDHSGRIDEINFTGANLLGFERAHSGLASLTQLVPKGQVSLWVDHLHRAAGKLRATTDFTFHNRKGKAIPVQLITCALPEARGRSTTVFRTILIDITQRRAAEVALAQTQQDYHRLIDTIEGIVWEADARSMEITFVSRHAERLLGDPLADVTRPSFWHNRIYVEDRERVTNAIARAVAKREPLRIDYRVIAADRRIVWLHDNVTTLERHGELRLLGVAVDVTEQHATQDHLHRTQEILERSVAERTAELRLNVQELESFSYSISHDLRAPLRAMLGFAEIALSVGGDELSPQIKDCLRRIMEGGVRADRLVQDVLAYSRVSRATFQLAPVNLDKFVPELIDQYPDFKSPKAKVRVQGPLFPVLAHEALLAQCVTNLVGNAVKFVAPGTVPQITISTKAEPGGQAVRLCIEDNGIGIAPENQGRIFAIFERMHSPRQYPGTGIGLAIVRKAVERMGGAVGVESQPGKGSRFWIQLKAP